VAVPPPAAARRREVPATAGLRVLGLETGGDHLGLALLTWRSPEAFELRAESLRFRGHRHADAVLVELHTMLAGDGLTPSDLDLLAVSRGPGGFTGVRVGLATALGLAVGAALPVWPVCPLLSLAAEGAEGLAGLSPRVVALLDARRGEVYAGAWDFGAAGAPPVEVLSPRVAPLDAVLAAVAALPPAAGPTRHVGSGAVAAGLVAPGRLHLGSPSRHALLAAAAFEAAGRDPQAVPPLDAAYLRKSEAELNAEKALANRAPIGD
jgi:tRNA threonylcarbamoyladenosine biosynthesis protein TsaB